MKTNEVKQTIRRRYNKCAEVGDATTTCCCSSEPPADSSYATEHGLYSKEELSLVPEISRSLSRGCGNPTGFADLRPGEVVVDFGCGAGIDAILAAQKVLPNGKVVGVDFSAQMIDRAKQAVSEARCMNVIEFVVADMEQVDVADSSADAVISNCVINLCPDKNAVYREMFRILKPGGRLAISDIVYEERIHPGIQEHLRKTWSGCVGGTIQEELYFEIVKNVGFKGIQVIARHLLATKELETMASCPGPEFTPAPDKADLDMVQGKVASVKFTALKPTISA